MKKIKIKLEYQCFPVWIYDEDNNLLENDLPARWIGDNELDPLCVRLQEQFDALYLDNGQDFKYVGFKDKVARKEFMQKLSQIVEKLYEKLGGDYEVENDIDMANI